MQFVLKMGGTGFQPASAGILAALFAEIRILLGSRTETTRTGKMPLQAGWKHALPKTEV
jgi:hypothetical protein